jgi:DNA-binding transcriptional regulator GbsR (MarR family)
MNTKLRTVKYQVSDETAAPEAVSEVEQIRRRFARAWGAMGGSWGVTPSTAAVQGYLLVHGGPVTDRELQDALGLSHRAIRVALEDGVLWGIVRQAEETRRTGQRGPAGRAWLALDDHWEWFRRVIAARKVREGDPVIAILEECLVDANKAGRDAEAKDLQARASTLLEFVREFDHGLSAVVRARTDVLRSLFAAMNSQKPDDLDRLLALLADVPEQELADAMKTMSKMSPTNLRRLLRLAGQPTIGRLLGR